MTYSYTWVIDGMYVVTGFAVLLLRRRSVPSRAVAELARVRPEKGASNVNIRFGGVRLQWRTATALLGGTGRTTHKLDERHKLP